MRSGFALGTVGTAVALALAGVCPAAIAQGGAAPLAGTLSIVGGRCDGPPTGSYFRMILPTGDRNGPFLANGESACGDETFTLLAPGTDGGIVLGAYQPEASPAFDEAGNSTSDRITAPTPFFGVDFSTSTNPTDPQTGVAVGAPTLSLHPDGSLSGDVRAFAASWNNQEFNQGAPKPDGSLPGNTATPSGTLDSTTGGFTVEWTSQIVGGPFDRFTGLWHLEGRLVSGEGPGTAAGAPAGTAAMEESAATSSGAVTPGAETSPSGGPGTDPAVSTTATTVPRTASGRDVVAAPIVSGGREPATWLVVLVTATGLGALASFVRLDRRIRRLERDT